MTHNEKRERERVGIWQSENDKGRERQRELLKNMGKGKNMEIQKYVDIK